MKSFCHRTTLFSLIAVPALLTPGFADENGGDTDKLDSKSKQHLKIELEPQGFIIESDGEVIELRGGKSDGQKLSLRLQDILGKGGSKELGELISGLVQAHPQEAGKLAQLLLASGHLDLLNQFNSANNDPSDDAGGLSELFAAGIELASPYYIGIEVTLPDAVLLAQLNIETGTSLVVKSVIPNSPAASAGLEKHDLLLTPDGAALSGRKELVELVRKAGEAEEPLQLVRLRQGEKHAVTVTPAKREATGIGAAFFGSSVVVPEAEEETDTEAGTDADSDPSTDAELKELREELNSQRQMLEQILSKLSDKSNAADDDE